jgi:hypothetical protein
MRRSDMVMTLCTSRLVENGSAELPCFRHGGSTHGFFTMTHYFGSLHRPELKAIVPSIP